MNANFKLKMLLLFSLVTLLLLRRTDESFCRVAARHGFANGFWRGPVCDAVVVDARLLDLFLGPLHSLWSIPTLQCQAMSKSKDSR
jgi:hypothetical protein